MIDHSDISEYSLDRFEQFRRNGVWGTCVNCPKTNNHKAFPEFCKNKNRSDHLLSIDLLCDSYKILRAG